MLLDVIGVMIGGAIGSAVRYAVSLVVGSPVDGFPWATFLVNVCGSFVLGMLSGFSLRSDILPRSALLLLGTGLCGGFTTFSALSMETLSLYQAGHVGIAVAYAGGSLIGGIGAAALGVGIAHRLTT